MDREMGELTRAVTLLSASPIIYGFREERERSEESSSTRSIMGRVKGGRLMRVINPKIAAVSRADREEKSKTRMIPTR